VVDDGFEERKGVGRALAGTWRAAFGEGVLAFGWGQSGERWVFIA
jgi:hypothetical protein